ncbi:hypothetical protein WJX81_003187 [Elliptochloris bilobata]|uniref:FAD-binding domain-containing protein n=1 Tax=Elliptochloris bilobata TaxID=381761 RepID=A0AAW1QXC0_9CHLO
MVGAAFAALLAANPLTAALRVLMLDRAPPPEALGPLPPVPGLRVSTLTPASVRLIERAGAWRDVAPPHSAAFKTMQVWDSSGSGCVRYSAAEAGEPVMGHVAENDLLQAALLRQLRQPGAGVELLWPAQLEGLHLPKPFSELQRDGGGAAPGALAELGLSGGRRLRARLVVGADGPRSHVRQLADLRTFGWAYGQRGLVATVRPEVANTCAWQRFLPHGPLALLPVRNGYANIVWTTTPRHAAELEAASPEAFADAVNEALQGAPTPARNFFLPAAAAESEFRRPPLVRPASGRGPKSFPLALRASGRYVRSRLALIGDAAHAVHPLAGQGVNLGLADAGALADALAYAVTTGQDVGDEGMLEGAYEAPRQAANGAMLAALDGLKRVFEPQSGLLSGLRGLGLDALNAVPGAKQRIVRYAMGV